MTDKVNSFDVASAALKSQARGAGYRRGAEQMQAFDLVEMFRARGVTFGTDGSDQNTK